MVLHSQRQGRNAVPEAEPGRVAPVSFLGLCWVLSLLPARPLCIFVSRLPIPIPIPVPIPVPG